MLKLKKINFTAIKVLSFYGTQMLRKHQGLTRFLFVKKKKKIIVYLYKDLKVKPLHIILLKTSTYAKIYDGQTKWMYFLIEDDDLLAKYKTIQDKVSTDIKKEFDSKPVYNKEFLKTKLKSHGGEVTDFYDK